MCIYVKWFNTSGRKQESEILFVYFDYVSSYITQLYVIDLASSVVTVVYVDIPNKL